MSFLTVAINIFNRVVPKRNYILFNSYPNICDNAYELYCYIVENRHDLIENNCIIWAVDGKTALNNVKIHPKTTIVEKKSIKGIWTFLRAKYVVSTHGYFRHIKSGNGQLQVNLWHGCGYKTLTPADRGYRGDITIVTSNAYKGIFSNLFDISERNVFVTGYPRNDILFSDKKILGKLNIEKRKYKKVIIWMPTYRKAALGHDGVDGSAKSFLASNLSKNECIKLNERLNSCGYYMIIKPHPMDAMTLEKFNDMSNINCITTEQLQKKGISLYELLANTDVLLSDYSSVIIDYLLLDRPIAMVLSDVEEYQNNRGFLFEPVEDYFPGPIISNFDMLLEYLSRMDSVNSKWEKKRKQLKHFMHKYDDDKSSERVANAIWGDKK